MAAPETRDDIKVSIFPSIDLTKAEVGEQFEVLVEATPLPGTKRTVSNIACVLDISGSMGAEATIQNSSGATESHGLSLLDVAKHGVKTVVKMMSADDYFCLVIFNHMAEVRIPLQQMTEENQTKALEELDKIVQGGGTNMWTGIEMGLNQLKAATTPDSLNHIICLTDGATSDRQVLLPNMKAYGKEHGGEAGTLPATLSTFGFGYNVESDLLTEVATQGSGTFCFIPDAGFVGTAFVNLMSYLLITNTVAVSLDIAPEDNVEFDGDWSSAVVKGNLASEASDTQLRVKLGTLQFGQARDVLLKMKVKKQIKSDDPYLTAKALFELPGKTQGQSQLAEGLPQSPLEPATVAKVAEQRARCAFVTTMQAVTKEFDQNDTEAQKKVTDLATLVTSEQAAAGGSSKYLTDLSQDVEGQVAEAVSKAEYFRKWGRHFLPSLICAHKLQMCNNFKDPGVQHYGGDLFKAAQDAGDTAFEALPAPKPSVRSGGYSSSAHSAPVNMAAYNDRYAG